MYSRILSTELGLAFAASLFTLGCGGEPGDAFESEGFAIVNGEPSDEMDDQVVEIVSRLSDVASVTCSATLIAPNAILTALHCVSYREDPEGTFTCNSDGSIDPDTPGAGSLGLPIDGENISVYVGANQNREQVAALGFEVFGTGALQICRGDLAVVVLDREIGTKVNALRFTRSVTLGEKLMSIGYGQTENGFLMGRHRRPVTVLDLGDVGSVPGTGLTPPDTFVVGAGPCHGDSGGPALSQETGAVTGLYSLTHSPSCTTATVKNTYTLVSPFEDTIRDALAFAGHEPVVEEGTGGNGTGGTAGTAGTEPAGEGSGSREDPACTCRTAGGRAQRSFAWAALGLVGFALARRRVHPARH